MKRLIVLIAIIYASCNAFAVCPGTQISKQQTALTFTDATVTDGAKYTYSVTAVGPTGESVCDSAPLLVIPATGTHSVVLTWAASTTPGVTYNVYRSSPPNPPTAITETVQ